MEFVLLHSCLAFPKFAFSLRTTDTSVHNEVRQDFDGEVRKSLSTILGAAISDPQWKQASLPVSKGGSDMRSAETHCLVEATEDVREKARLQCLVRDGAGDWLGALPSKGLGLHLRKAEFCMAGRYLLGMAVFSSEGLLPGTKMP